MKKFFVLMFLIPACTFAQSKDAEIILNNLITAFNFVKDYSVEAKIKVDMQSLKVPQMKVKIFFKQPNKVHFQSEGFALLPRDGLFTSPLSFLDIKHTAIYVKDELVDGIKTSVVKIIPLEDKGDLIITTLWIDQNKNEIIKAESSTKLNGSFSLFLNYDSKIKYPLPSSMVFSFNLPENNLLHDMNDSQFGKRGRTNSGLISGKIYITYSNYKINIGIPDSIFDGRNKN